MSSAEIAARSIKQVDAEDLKVLQALERSIPLFESVPLRRIEKVSGLHPDRVKFRLGRLNKFGFITRDQFGYILLTAGLDLLALEALVKANLVSGMGKSIGMGKESDVFEVRNDSGERAALKFYRIGRTSFRTTRKSRDYVPPENQHQWLTINIRAALKEEEGLKKAAAAMVVVPKFFSRNRHAVLMEEIDGVMLYRCRKSDVEEPKTLLRDIFENMQKAYNRAHMINGDLSEYNILYDGNRVWIIDWPQFAPTDHPNAAELLIRDIANVITFFEKRFDLTVDIGNALKFVRGERKSLSIRQG